MNPLPSKAVQEYFDLYFDRLYLFAFKMLECKETSRDLVQDAFITLMQGKLLKIEDPNSIKSYLYSTVKNAALNHIRHQKFLSRAHSREYTENFEEPIVEKMIQAEVIGELYAALNLLPEGCRLIFKMGYLEGMKNHEIAEKLNISVNTIKTQKKRGLAILRSHLPPQTYYILVCLLLK
ncbi:RNA polymerase sigma-70 factor [Sphingobacterium detergens]